MSREVSNGWPERNPDDTGTGKSKMCGLAQYASFQFQNISFTLLDKVKVDRRLMFPGFS